MVDSIRYLHDSPNAWYVDAQAGADPMVRDRFGRTPIICAARGVNSNAPIVMRDILDHVPQKQWRNVANTTDYFGIRAMSCLICYFLL